MKLIQLNAWGGRIDRRLKFFFEKEQPDVVCLQEVISVNREESGFFYTLGNVQRDIKADYEIFAPAFSFKYMRGVARFGNAIVSRQPFIKSEFFFTHQDHQDDFDTNEHGFNMRNVVHAVTKINDKSVHILTHHGFHVDAHKDGNDDTMKQMEILADYVENLEGPIILTGDFNLAPHSKSLERLNKMLTNLSMKHKLVTTRNELVHKNEVCDYIFVSDEIKVTHFEASEEIISDHQALIMEFDV